MDPVEFLRNHPPFDAVSESGLATLGGALEVVYAPKNRAIMRIGDPRNDYLYVVRKGAARLEKDGRLLTVLEEGDMFGFTSLLAGSGPNFDVVADDELLLYRIPREAFDRVRGERTFNEFFVNGLAQRLRQAQEREPQPLTGSLGAPVRRLATDVPPFVDPETTVEVAARRMSEHRSRAILVRTDPPGIVTDDDLRTRVLARGLGPEVRVGEVASRPMKTLPAHSSLFEALLFMLEERIHHLPLVEDGVFVGILTDRDLLRYQMKSPLHVLRQVERFGDAEGYEGYAREVDAMVEALVWAGVDPARIGRIVSAVNDALVQRLLRRAEEDLGAPPTPYAWIVFGSEGRREQALITDQDNAIVFLEDTETAREYFGTLAKRVVDGLVRASFPPCKGGFMATNWCRPLDEWRRLFGGWIDTPSPSALIDVANFFDFRAVHGGLDLEPLHEVVARAREQQIFLAHLARAAMGFRPPAGLLRWLRSSDDDGTDLKKRGILPVVGLARVYALEAGIRYRSTVDRLDAAATESTISREGADTLSEAFRYLLKLRLQHQLDVLREGGRPDNRVHADRLGATDRRHLKETFQAIREMQEAAAFRYRIDLLR